MSGFPKINGYGLFPLLQWLHITNGAPSLAGKDPLSKILWLQQHRTDIWGRIYKLLDVKDYLLFRLTNRYVTTPDCAHLSWLFDSRTNCWQWSQTLLKKTGISKDMLPEIIQGIREKIEQATTTTKGRVPVLLTPPQIRPWIRKMLEAQLPTVSVMSYNEIVRGFEVESHGIVVITDEA